MYYVHMLRKSGEKFIGVFSEKIVFRLLLYFRVTKQPTFFSWMHSNIATASKNILVLEWKKIFFFEEKPNKMLFYFYENVFHFITLYPLKNENSENIWIQFWKYISLFNSYLFFRVTHTPNVNTFCENKNTK